MGAAKDSFTCAKIVANQVVSVGNLALTIGSLGSSTSLTAGLSAPEKASRFAKLTQEFTRLKTQWDVLVKTNQNVKNAVNVFKAANAGRQGYVAMDTLANATTEEDMVRMAAQIAAILDPSGAAGVVAAYTALSILEKADHHRRQIRINIKIVDIDVQKALDLGIKWNWTPNYSVSEKGNGTTGVGFSLHNLILPR